MMNQAAKRQYELKDPAMRDDLAAARAVLKKHSMMLLTASKAYVRSNWRRLVAAREIARSSEQWIDSLEKVASSFTKEFDIIL